MYPGVGSALILYGLDEASTSHLPALKVNMGEIDMAAVVRQILGD